MEWDEVLNCVKDVKLIANQDNVRRMLEQSGKYTTRSLYKHLLNPGAIYTPMMQIWEAKIPLKVKNFMWLLNKDRIQAAEQLKKKNRKGSEKCKLCNQVGTPSHVIFSCVVAQWPWCELRDFLGWDYTPVNISDLNTLTCWDDRIRKSKAITVIISAACRIVWLTRNEYVFQDRILSNPEGELIVMLQKWSTLSTGEERRMIKECAAKMARRTGMTAALVDD